MTSITSHPTVENFTASQMAQAGVPMELAKWHMTVGRKLRRMNVLDVLRVEQVSEMVHTGSA